MNREIKFRGLRTDGKGWVYGGITSHLHTIDDKTFIVHNSFFEGDEENEHLDFTEVIPETVGQFTGLYDKNGKEIYEGDLLTHRRKFNVNHVSICTGFYRIGSFCLYYGNLIYEPIDLLKRSDHNFEITGNIHQQ